MNLLRAIEAHALAAGKIIRDSLALPVRNAQIAECKYCRPHARPFRLGFTRKVPVFPVCSPAALQALGRAWSRTLAAVNLAPAVRHVGSRITLRPLEALPHRSSTQKE